MAKILINAVAAKSGGIVTYVANLARELATQDPTREYLFYVPPRLARLLEGLGDHIRAVATDAGFGPSWRRFLWDQVALRRIALREGVRLLFSCSDFGMLRPPCRQILAMHNQVFFSPLYLDRILPRKTRRFRLEFALRRRLISLSVRSSDVVMTPSLSMLEDVRSRIRIPERKTVVNHFGVPLETFRRTAARPAGPALRVLYVSEYSDHKNLTTLLRAVLLLKEQKVDGFRLRTTLDPGHFPDEEIVSRRLDSALASHPLVASVMESTAPVPDDDVPTLYAESDLFVFPSLVESFGYPLAEAMASGLPIVASDIPVCREVCGDAAVYFSPLDAADLARKLLTLLNDPDLRRRLGEAGLARARTHFNGKDHVRRLLEIIAQPETRPG